MSWKPLHGWWDALSDWGWIIPTIGWAATVVVLMIGLPEAGVDTNPTKSDRDINIVASSGVQGFPVEEFVCDDEDTLVSVPVHIPDTVSTSYQAIRVRDGKTETVVVVINNEDSVAAATHYRDGPDGQISQPAFLSDKAVKCLKDKSS
jgi:hypothetical protein